MSCCGRRCGGSCGCGCWTVCQVKPSPNVSQADVLIAVAKKFLPLSGGTLTGPLLLTGGPTARLQAATKDYVDSHVTSVLQLQPSVADVASLPTSGNQQGDVRQTLDTNSLYLYDGTQWNPMGKASTPIPAGDATTDGYMLFWDASHAQWQVRPQPSSLPTSASSGQVLKWDAATSAWQPADPIPDGRHAGDYLRWDDTSGSWEPVEPSIGHLSDGPGNIVANPDDVLTWDPSTKRWVPREIPDSSTLVVGTWSDLPATASDGRIAYVQDNDVLAVFDPVLSGWMQVGQPQRFASPAALPSYYTEPGMLAYSESDKTIYVQVPGGSPGTMVWQPIDDAARKQAAPLSAATDVAATAPADGQALVWDGTAQTWQPGTVATSGGLKAQELTQTAYNAVVAAGTVDAGTLYLIVSP